MQVAVKARMYRKAYRSLIRLRVMIQIQRGKMCSPCIYDLTKRNLMVSSLLKVMHGPVDFKGLGLASRLAKGDCGSGSLSLPRRLLCFQRSPRRVPWKTDQLKRISARLISWYQTLSRAEASMRR